MKRNKINKGKPPERREPTIVWSNGKYRHNQQVCDCIDCEFYRIVADA